MLIEAWESFVRDANLMTRTMGAQRAAALFEHAAVTNKVGQTVLRLPQFVHALVHMAYLRSNPVSALGAAHAKPTPLPKAVETLIHHLYSRFMATPPPKPLTMWKPGGAPAAKGAMLGAPSQSARSEGAMMVPGTPSSLGADSRRNDGRAASPAKRGAGAPAATAAGGGGGGRSASTLAAREAHGWLSTAPLAAAALPGAAALPAPAPGASGGGASQGGGSSQPPAAAAGRLVHQPPTGGARSLGGAGMPPVALADATNSAKVTKLGQGDEIRSARPQMVRPGRAADAGRPSRQATALAGMAKFVKAGGGGGGGGMPRFDGLLPSMRKNLYLRMFTAWREYTSESVVEGHGLVVKFRDRKRGGKLTHLFHSWKLWLHEWNQAINEAGFILRPHLPLNQHSAFSHWRYWSHAPQLMTSISAWYIARVSPEDFANASEYTRTTTTRAARLKGAFGRWEKLHALTVRAVSMTNHLQRRLCATLLLRVVDAWVRLTL